MLLIAETNIGTRHQVENFEKLAFGVSYLRTLTKTALHARSIIMAQTNLGLGSFLVGRKKSPGTYLLTPFDKLRDVLNVDISLIILCSVPGESCSDPPKTLRSAVNHHPPNLVYAIETAPMFRTQTVRNSRTKI